MDDDGVSKIVNGQLSYSAERKSDFTEAASKFRIEFKNHLRRKSIQCWWKKQQLVLMKKKTTFTDKTGIYWKCLLTKALAEEEEKNGSGFRYKLFSFVQMLQGNRK